MKKLICKLFFLFSFISYPQTNALQEKYTASERVYTYHLICEDMLNCIKTNFYDLSYEVQKNKLWLDKHFGLSKKNAGLFIEEMEISSLSEYESERGFDECESLDKQTATNILKNFEKVVSNTLIEENALAFEYKDNPFLEFTNGYTQTFSTKGHPRAKKSDWKVKIPKSWKATEPKNENVIQRFQNDFGLGESMIILTVDDIPNEFTKGLDFEKVFRKNVIDTYKKELGASKVTIISFKPMNIALLKGFLAVIDIELEQLGHNMKLRQYNYQFFDNDYMYSFQGCIYFPDDVKNIDDFDSLFLMCVNSIVVNKKENNVIYLQGTTHKKTVNVKISESDYNFLLDTGASISLISKDLINKLLEKGVISNRNFLGKDYVQTADGKQHFTEFWNLPSIIVGHKKINDVNFAVMGGDIEPLLGMNILNKLNIWKIDLENNKIYLK